MAERVTELQDRILNCLCHSPWICHCFTSSCITRRHYMLCTASTRASRLKDFFFLNCFFDLRNRNSFRCPLTVSCRVVTFLLRKTVADTAYCLGEITTYCFNVNKNLTFLWDLRFSLQWLRRFLVLGCEDVYLGRRLHMQPRPFYLA